MKKRINTGFMLIAAIAIVVTAVCSMFLFYQILEEQIFDDLKANAHVVSVISPKELYRRNLLPTSVLPEYVKNHLQGLLHRCPHCSDQHRS